MLYKVNHVIGSSIQVLCVSDTNIFSSRLIQFFVSFAFISLASVLVIKLKISIWFFVNGMEKQELPNLNYILSFQNDLQTTIYFKHSWFDLSKPDAAYYCCPSYTIEDINVNILNIRIINNLPTNYKKMFYIVWLE